MTAQVVSITEARRARGEEIRPRITHMERALKKWKADLERWPAAFAAPVGALLDKMPEPHIVSLDWNADSKRYWRRHDPGDFRIDAEREGTGELKAESLIEWLGFCEAIDQRLRGRRSGYSCMRERRSEFLLVYLWLTGQRRLNRRALAAAALERLDRTEKLLALRKFQSTTAAEVLRNSLEQDLVLSTGQPYTVGGRKASTKKLEVREQEIARLGWMQTDLIPWARLHPVQYALGSLPRWARERL